MKAMTYSWWAMFWALIAFANVVWWAVSGDMTRLVCALMFFLFSAEDRIISEIKRTKEDA